MADARRSDERPDPDEPAAGDFLDDSGPGADTGAAHENAAHEDDGDPTGGPGVEDVFRAGM